MVAKVLVDTNIHKLNKVYDYLIPEAYASDAEVGKRVAVNFGNGKGKEIEGIIVKLEEDNEKNISKLKYITHILDTDSYLDENRLKLAKWIARMYFCNVYTALRLMLPPTPGKKLQIKELKGNQITVVSLKVSKVQVLQDIETKKITSAKHIKLLKELIENNEIPIEDIIGGLKISRPVIKTVEKNGYIILQKQDIAKNEYLDAKLQAPLTPTSEQKKVIDGLKEKIVENKFNVSLLKGVTGSGKTEVYLQAIDRCITLGKTAIVLVPEISLTDQTKRRFISRFGKIVSVLHSKMTVNERQDAFKAIVTGETKIVIGPRSALFVPLKNIGLIIIDEEHDTSYVSQTTPKYNTREVATRIAYMENAVLLLGSATPDICTMYKASINKIDYYVMNSRPGATNMPEVEVVDMKQDALNNKSQIISMRLKEELIKNIEAHEQSFIFLNRRGYSSYITCKTCGKTLRCPNCDVNLTYHKKSNLLLCHYCSYCETLKDICPICGADTLMDQGLGTERIEEELHTIFPNIKTLRMDMDTTIKRGSSEKILDKFKKDNIDVLVGTQMISKGHDIENVTLVGVINADYVAGNDYNTQEKSFSNLLQVSGRAGRGSKKGRVMLQTYDTGSYTIEALKDSSYDLFYNKEIEFRKMANYPPFTDILLIELTGKEREKVVKDSTKLYDIFSNTKGIYKIYSPKSPYVGKINSKYRVQVVIKGKFSDKLLDLLYENLSIYDKIKNKDVTVSFAKNPVKIG